MLRLLDFDKLAQLECFINAALLVLPLNLTLHQLGLLLLCSDLFLHLDRVLRLKERLLAFQKRVPDAKLVRSHVLDLHLTLDELLAGLALITFLEQSLESALGRIALQLVGWTRAQDEVIAHLRTQASTVSSRPDVVQLESRVFLCKLDDLVLQLLHLSLLLFVTLFLCKCADRI